MTYEPLRAGLIGCGRIGMRHLSAMAQLDPKLRCFAACDASEEALLSASSLASHAARFQDYRQLLAAQDYDLIAVASPSGHHAAHAMAALQAGAHVVVEKPMALELASARAIAIEAARHERALFVCYQMRDYPTLQLVRRAVQEGHLGRVHFVDVRVFWTRPQSYYDAAAWRGTRQQDGGVLLNQTNHYFDLLTWIFGAPVAVSGKESCLGRDIETSDSAAFALEWPDMLGTFAASMLTYPKNFEASLTILGERGTIRLTGGACDVIETWELAQDFCTPQQREQASAQTLHVRQSHHLPFYRRVLSTLEGHHAAKFGAHPVDLSGPALVEAAQRASALGRRVLVEAVDLPSPRDPE